MKTPPCGQTVVDIFSIPPLILPKRGSIVLTGVLLINEVLSRSVRGEKERESRSTASINRAVHHTGKRLFFEQLRNDLQL